MDASNGHGQIKIERPLYEQEQLHDVLEYHKFKVNVLQGLLSNWTKCKPKKTLYKTVPAVQWLSTYKWKENFVMDLIAGITVAIMHIPQGMAYGLLGNVPPIVGIYMAFFPVLIYVFLGTSRHNSMGTFAVVGLMTGKVVLEHSDPYYFKQDSQVNVTDAFDVPKLTTGYMPIEIATAVTFMVAMFQLLMFVCRLGVISSLLSETLISGFTTGAAIHVLTSQINDLFGYKIPKHRGLFVVVNTYYSISKDITDINSAATIISIVTIIVSVANNEIIKPLVAKKCSFPIPIELLAIFLGALASRYFHLGEVYGVKTIGDIPSGLPLPAVPKFSVMGSIMFDSLIIAIVSYTINLSMGLIFSQKCGYEIDPNQELLAQGSGNVIGSFFSCMPFTASMSRSVIQHSVGGQTQIASMVSCGVLFVVLMWIGPFFEPVPKPVLASTIVVALKGMLMQLCDFFRIWKLSKMDAAVWLVTFLGVVLISLDIGLLIGVIMSLLSIFVLGMKPYTCLLGWVPHTDLYLDINRYKGAEEINHLKIFHYQGGINFASRNYFKTEIHRLVGIEPLKEYTNRKTLAELSDLTGKSEDNLLKIKKKCEKLKARTNHDVKCVILDFSALSYVDPSGVNMLKQLAHSFQRIDVPIYIAGCSAPVYEMMSKCDLCDAKKNIFRVFPTTHDAVQCARSVFSNRSDNSVVNLSS